MIEKDLYSFILLSIPIMVKPEKKFFKGRRHAAFERIQNFPEASLKIYDLVIFYVIGVYMVIRNERVNMMGKKLEKE